MVSRGNRWYSQDQENTNERRPNQSKPKTRSPPISAPLKKPKTTVEMEDDDIVVIDESTRKLNLLDEEEYDRMMYNIFNYGLPPDGCIVSQMACVLPQDEEEEKLKERKRAELIRLKRSKTPDPDFYMEGWVDENYAKDTALLKKIDTENKIKAKEAAAEAKKLRVIALKKEKKEQKEKKHYEEWLKKEEKRRKKEMPIGTDGKKHGKTSSYVQIGSSSRSPNSETVEFADVEASIKPKKTVSFNEDANVTFLFGQDELGRGTKRSNLQNVVPKSIVKKTKIDGNVEDSTESKTIKTNVKVEDTKDEPMQHQSKRIIEKMKAEEIAAEPSEPPHRRIIKTVQVEDAVDEPSEPQARRIVKKAKVEEIAGKPSDVPSTSSKVQQPARKTCSHCGETNTPAWGRDGKGGHWCNACRVYAKNMNKPRPESCYNNK